MLNVNKQKRRVGGCRHSPKPTHTSGRRSTKRNLSPSKQFRFHITTDQCIDRLRLHECRDFSVGRGNCCPSLSQEPGWLGSQRRSDMCLISPSDGKFVAVSSIRPYAGVNSLRFYNSERFCTCTYSEGILAFSLPKMVVAAGTCARIDGSALAADGRYAAMIKGPRVEIVDHRCARSSNSVQLEQTALPNRINPKSAYGNLPFRPIAGFCLLRAER